MKEATRAVQVGYEKKARTLCSPWFDEQEPGKLTVHIEFPCKGGSA